MEPLFGLDFSRQTSVKRLAIDASMLSTLPSLPALEELAALNLQQDQFDALGIFTQVSRLTISGDYYALSQFDSTPFVKLTSIVIDSDSASVVNKERYIRGGSEASSASSGRLSSSLRASMASISIAVNDTWTNQTFTDAFCSYDSSSVTAITVTVVSSQKWFRLPSCISNWTGLQLIYCDRCQLPNFTALPTTPTTLNFMYSVGTWTQAEAGIVAVDHAEANFFDWSWLPNFSNLVSLYIVSSTINGTLPNQYSNPNLGIFSVAGTSAEKLNQFAGTIAPDWFSRFPSMITMVLTDNKLTGTIPNTRLANVVSMFFGNNQFTHWPALAINTTSGFTAPTKLKFIDLSNNALVEIPSESDFQSMILQQFVINGNPGLAGRSFPNIFVNTSVARGSALVGTITASGCGFVGALPEIPSSQISLYASSSMRLSFDNNAFSGTVPSSWSGLSLNLLNLSSNALSGTLATVNQSTGLIASQFITSAETLSVNGNNFTGVMFNISSMTTMTSLSAQMPNVDFCATARLSASQDAILFPQTKLTTCTFYHTNASECMWAYPTKCLGDVSPGAPQPIAPPSYSTPVSQCPLPSPGASFTCVGKNWVSTGSVTQETVILPSGSSTAVSGNLTTSSIIFSGITSNLLATGCISAGNGSSLTVTVELSQEDVERIGTKPYTQSFLTQSSSCEEISASVITVVSSKVKTCKQVKVDKVSNSLGLAATFSLNTSKCNVWWIILVSVLCGLILVAIIVVVIVVSCNKNVREKLRPFSQSRRTRAFSARQTTSAAQAADVEP